MERAGEKNAYYCDACGGYIVTVNLDDGVTPSMLACRVKGEPRDPGNDCRGTMRSLFYPPDPWPERDGFGHEIPTEPTHEWYAPSEEEVRRLSPAGRDHARRGGLSLRRREAVAA